MAYRKRMAERRDATKSDEWNRAYARLEKLVPVIVMGNAVTPVNVTAVNSAIADALKAGVDFGEIEQYDKIAKKAAADAGEEIELTPELQAAAKAAAAAREEATAAKIDEQKAQQDKLRAFSVLQDALPKDLFGRVVVGAKFSAEKTARLKTAIDEAKAAGVDLETIVKAEQAYAMAVSKDASASADDKARAAKVQSAAAANPTQQMYDAFFEMQKASPTVVFNKVVGNADAGRLAAAIDKARAAGVDESSIAMAEAKLRLLQE